MASRQANVFFDGVNLDNCLKLGLTITGTARCPYCQQTFSFQLHLQKHVDELTGDMVATADPDNYDICLNFSRDGLLAADIPALENKKMDDDEICVPCRGCSLHCPKLAKRYG